jgi:hypothetical protein
MHYIVSILAIFFGSIYTLGTIQNKKWLVRPEKSESNFLEFVQYFAKKLFGREFLKIFNYIYGALLVLFGIVIMLL